MTQSGDTLERRRDRRLHLKAVLRRTWCTACAGNSGKQVRSARESSNALGEIHAARVVGQSDEGLRGRLVLDHPILSQAKPSRANRSSTHEASEVETVIWSRKCTLLWLGQNVTKVAVYGDQELRLKRVFRFLLRNEAFLFLLFCTRWVSQSLDTEVIRSCSAQYFELCCKKMTRCFFDQGRHVQSDSVRF